MLVVKRVGNKEPYSFDKIESAVKKAFENCGEEFKSSVQNRLIKYFETAWEDIEDGEDITVDDVHNKVEQFLMKNNYFNVSRSYIRKRYQKSIERAEDKRLTGKIADKLMAQNIENQNANIDEASFGGRIGECSRVVTKDFALTHCMSKKSRMNHENNEIYIHDLDSYAAGMHNCLSIPFDELLANGFNTRQTNVRPAGSINTAFQIIAVAFQIQSLNQFGGVSATHLDWTMVPYVRKSFFKHFTDNFIHEELKREGIDPSKLSSEEIDEYKKKKRDEFKEKYDIKDENFAIGSLQIPCINFHVDDEKIKEINIDWYNSAIYDTINELNQAVEGMYHNLNTLQSRSGNQLPFTSINYGTCTLSEGRMVIRALLEGSIKGVGKHHVTPIFPCGIFQSGKGINQKSGDPNYDLFRIALESTSKRLYPNYANIDWSGNTGYDKNDPRTYFSTMGCRTANGFDINGFGQLKDGRGNICPVTIILPTLAMEAGRDIEKFMKLLGKKIEEAKDMLIERFEWICSQSYKSAKFMYENHTMAGYIPEEGIRSALKHGTLALGQLGLAETLQLLINADQTTDEGMKLAKRIESLFKKRCAKYKEEYKLNFGVYYTPAENLCYTALKKFRDKYGVIPNVSDKEFFTNSIHVPVWIDIDPFEKIDIESQLTGYSTAGCITYCELPATTKHNLDALETLVLYAMGHDIPYFAINVPNDTCNNCGYCDEMGDTCPECGSSDIKRLRRVTGYLTGDYQTAFNEGKKDEVEHRVKHIKG